MCDTQHPHIGYCIRSYYYFVLCCFNFLFSVSVCLGLPFISPRHSQWGSHYQGQHPSTSRLLLKEALAASLSTHLSPIFFPFPASLISPSSSVLCLLSVHLLPAQAAQWKSKNNRPHLHRYTTLQLTREKQMNEDLNMMNYTYKCNTSGWAHWE